MNLAHLFGRTVAAAAFAMSGLVSSGAEEAGKGVPNKNEPAAHVLFEFRIVEVPDATARNLPVLNLQQPFEEDASKGGRLKFGVVTNVLGAQRYQQLLQAMAESNGVKLIAAPRITTRSKQKATVETTREFRYPTEWETPAEPGKKPVPKSFATRGLGITVEAEAEVNEDGTLKLDLTARAVALLGFIDTATKKPLLDLKAASEPPVVPRELALPVFEVQQAAAPAKIHFDQTVLLILAPTEETAPFTSPYAGKTLIALVTARRPAPVVADENAPAPAPAFTDGPPFAIPVKGKPKFVVSPYAPDAGFIDVGEFPPGAEIKDPYSGKRLRVP
jgi:hypothetical protein